MRLSPHVASHQVLSHTATNEKLGGDLATRLVLQLIAMLSICKFVKCRFILEILVQLFTCLLLSSSSASPTNAPTHLGSRSRLRSNASLRTKTQHDNSICNHTLSWLWYTLHRLPYSAMVLPLWYYYFQRLSLGSLPYFAMVLLHSAWLCHTFHIFCHTLPLLTSILS